MTDPTNPDIAAERPPYLLATLVALGALTLYVLTLAPTTQYWDASEYITAHTLWGFPPARKSAVVIWRTRGAAPLGTDYARRHQSLRGRDERGLSGSMVSHWRAWLGPSWRPQPGDASSQPRGAVVGATKFTVWNQSVVNEKVYTPACCDRVVLPP